MRVMINTNGCEVSFGPDPSAIFKVLKIESNSFDCADKKADYTDKVISLISVISIKSLCNQIPSDSEEYLDNGETEIGSLKKVKNSIIRIGLLETKHFKL